MKLTNDDLAKLTDVNENLVNVVILAREIVPFAVVEGLRTVEKQRQLVAQGKSKTMNSRHLTGHAVDLAPLDSNGQVSWDWDLFYPLAEAIKKVASELNVSIIWGGNWENIITTKSPINADSRSKTFADGPHFELDRTVYPA